MSKKVIVALLLVVMAAFSACGNPSTPDGSGTSVPTTNHPDDVPAVSQTSNGREIDFKAQYIRTNGYVPDAVYPIITVISSREELEQYYEDYKDIYDLSAHPTVYIDTTIGFLDAIEKYPDKFFAKQFLLLILLEEGSGSIRHKLKRVEENGTIVIDRLRPEPQTCDMAEWHIFIELDNSFLPEQFHVEFIDKNVS